MRNYSFLIALCAGLMSCEKVIDVDLNEGSPQLVIEAPLYEGAHFFEVKISKTASYFDNETIPFVNDAEVFLEGTDGTSTALEFVGDGKYGAEVYTKNQSFYTLRVNHEMGEYLASSYLHQPVGIEQLTYEVSSVSGPPIGPESDTTIGDDYVVTVHFTDVPDQDNYYRFNAFANGRPLLSPFGGGYYLSNDFERDGDNFEYQLIRANVKAGDNVMVELWTIDQSTYDYFDTFEASGGPGPQQSASPANPISNWTNGGLGYFAAIAKTRMAVEIKPQMLKTGRIPVPLIHASVWLLFFSVPYSTLLFSDAVPLSVIYRFSILNLLLVSLFYFNTEVLVPKLLLKDKLVLYVLSAICMVALFPMAVWASTHFGFDFEPFDAGLNHGEGQLPFPAIKDKRVAFATLPPLLVIAIGTSIKLIAFRRKYQGLEEQRQKEQLTTELAFLKSQINPHFFFNTLNNIYALVEVDVDKAKDGMHKLSKLMRYHLYKTNKDYVEVRSELEFLKDYLQLMRLRLQDVVQVRFNENLAQSHALIPPLLLEPFVENAFKHGVSYSKPSHIEIELTSDSSYLHFSVRNSLSEKGDILPDEGGLGIQNVVRRLALIFPDDAHELKYGVRADEYIVEMKLPLKYDQMYRRRRRTTCP